MNLCVAKNKTLFTKHGAFLNHRLMTSFKFTCFLSDEVQDHMKKFRWFTDNFPHH